MELLDAEKRVVEAGPFRTRLTPNQARGRSRFTQNRRSRFTPMQVHSETFIRTPQKQVHSEPHAKCVVQGYLAHKKTRTPRTLP